MSTKMRRCEVCYNGRFCRGCAACHGTGLENARYCDGCRFLHSDEDLLLERKTGLRKCATCRKDAA